MTRGDGLRERTARVAGEEPHKPKRNAKRSPRKVSEQWRRTIRWMVRWNAFAIPQAERLLSRLSLHAECVALR